jgi:hypothetical protein
MGKSISSYASYRFLFILSNRKVENGETARFAQEYARIAIACAMEI